MCSGMRIGRRPILKSLSEQSNLLLKKDNTGTKKEEKIIHRSKMIQKPDIRLVKKSANHSRMNKLRR